MNARWHAGRIMFSQLNSSSLLGQEDKKDDTHLTVHCRGLGYSWLLGCALSQPWHPVLSHPHWVWEGSSPDPRTRLFDMSNVDEGWNRTAKETLRPWHVGQRLSDQTWVPAMTPWVCAGSSSRIRVESELDGVDSGVQRHCIDSGNTMH